MAIVGRKTLSAEETAAIVSAAAVARGKDQAQTRIIGLLGRGKPFVRVHVGLTDVDLGPAPQARGGYDVTTIFTASSSHTVAAVGKAVGAWLQACHGARYEAGPAKPVLKPGTKSLYVAVLRAEPPPA